jgi:hypothetical protein
MTDFNINVNPYLDQEIIELVTNLEKLTNVPAGKFLANLVSGKDELADLELANKLLERKKKNPNPKTYTSGEVDRILGFI